MRLNEQELIFREMHKGESKTMKIGLTHKNLLNQSIAINLPGSGKNVFSVNPTTFTPQEASGVLELEITCAPTSLGKFKSSLTVTCGDLSTELQLSATVVPQKGVYVFGGGDASKEAPYLISAPGHLWELSTAVDQDRASFARKFSR